MRKLYCYLLLPIILALTIQQTDRNLQIIKNYPALGGEKWAVVIGINNYKFIPQLYYAINDAKAVASTLEDKYNFDHVILLTKENETTRENILRVIADDLRQQVGKNDQVLIYFSGHGQDISTIDGSLAGYLIPIEGRKELLASTCISMREIYESAKLIPAKHILYVIDCCFSGIAGALPKSPKVPSLSEQSLAYLKKLTKEKGGQVMTAGKSKEKAGESDQLQHGFFTYYFLEALGGSGDINYDGLITVDELYSYIKPRVERISNNRQTPQLRFLDRGGEGEFVFVLGRREPLDEDLEAKQKRLEEMKKAAKEAEMAEEAFQAASKLNTIEGWQLFIQDYSNSSHISEAKRKLEELKKALEEAEKEEIFTVSGWDNRYTWNNGETCIEASNVIFNFSENMVSGILNYRLYDRDNPNAILQLFIAIEREIVVNIYNGIPGYSGASGSKRFSFTYDQSRHGKSATIYLAGTQALTLEIGKEHYENTEAAERCAIGQIEIYKKPHKDIKLNTTDAKFYLDQGKDCLYKKQYENAIKYCSHAIELNNKDPYAYYIRGLAYAWIRKYDQAIADFTKAIELNPEYSYAYYNRGNAFIEKGQYELAIADCSRAIKLNPNDAYAYYIRGLAYEKMGLKSHAKANYEMAKQLRKKK